MASKRRNMFYQNKKQETTEIVSCAYQEQGFVMTDRHSGLDRDRAMLAIRGLARFHAMSSVLVDRGRLDPAKLADYPYLQNSESFNNYFKGAIDTLLSVIRSRWEPKWRPIADRIEDCTRDFGPKLMQLGKLQDGAFNVLIHGDCWINNMMFKYPQGSNVPKELRTYNLQKDGKLHVPISVGLQLERLRVITAIGFAI
ncbi:hypothetical protein AAG570_000676 [Ranatra chinensis]|uniref:CHK kinase-like domain-containing protein n=1 Tax=Ranatra chinensis TaxID=642074 RepID=A0ABD0YXQ7_9HEMI